MRLSRRICQKGLVYKTVGIICNAWCHIYTMKFIGQVLHADTWLPVNDCGNAGCYSAACRSFLFTGWTDPYHIIALIRSLGHHQHWPGTCSLSVGLGIKTTFQPWSGFVTSVKQLRNLLQAQLVKFFLTFTVHSMYQASNLAWTRQANLKRFLIEKEKR